MPTGWDPEYVATGLRGLPVTYDDEQQPLLKKVFGNFKNPFNKKLDDDETIQSIKIICYTLYLKVSHIYSKLEELKYPKKIIRQNTNTIEEAFDTYNTTQEYKLANEKYKESMKRLINITKYKNIFNSNIYKEYIKDVYFHEDDDTTINEDPQESLDNLINTLRDIVNDNTYIEYIRNTYKLDDSISKEQIYEELIEHLEKIKFSKLTINERDKILGQSGGNNKQYKEILGKRRRIYKIKGSRKEHIKYKGQLIPVSDYKKLFKK
jgi:hypothetical protein